jgi:hypothetical protein
MLRLTIDVSLDQVDQFTDGRGILERELASVPHRLAFEGPQGELIHPTGAVLGTYKMQVDE